jgi:hypothetical protein
MFRPSTIFKKINVLTAPSCGAKARPKSGFRSLGVVRNDDFAALLYGPLAYRWSRQDGTFAGGSVTRSECFDSDFTRINGGGVDVGLWANRQGTYRMYITTFNHVYKEGVPGPSQISRRNRPPVADNNFTPLHLYVMSL